MTRCDRCEEQTMSTTGSYFNTEMICPSCDERERSHSDFERARRIEHDAVKNGNMNFEGIGLPKELESRSR